MDLRDYLRVGQAAELLGVTDQTIRNWHSSGKLAGLRHPVNGYHLFRRADVEALLESARRAYRDSGGRLPCGAGAVDASDRTTAAVRPAAGKRKSTKR